MTKSLIKPHTEFPISTEHTIAAWRCDEASGSLLDAGPSGRDLAVSAGAPGAAGAMFGVNRSGSAGARTFDGSTDYCTVASDAAERARMQGEISFGCIFKIDNTSGLQTFLSFSGGRINETEAHNFMLLVGFSGDEIKAGWEYSTGTNAFQTTTGFNIQTGVEYVLTVSRYATKAGTAGNWDQRIDMWRVDNKEHQVEYMLDATPASGGTSSDWHAGAEQGGVFHFPGTLDEMHVVGFGDPDGYWARWFFGTLVGFDYDEEILYSTGNYSTVPRVWIENGDGEMVNLSALKPEDNTNYLVGVEISRSVSSFSRTATIHLRREFDKFSLAPDMEESLFNKDSGGSFAAQIHLRRRVFIEVAVVPAGRTPNDWDYILHFDGLTNDVAWPGETMAVLCNDLSQELESTFIMDERSYAGTPISSIDDSGASNAVVVQFTEDHRLAAGDSFNVVDTDNYDGAYTVNTVDSATQVTANQTTAGGVAAEAVGYITHPTASSTVLQQIIDDNDPADAAYANEYKGGKPDVWEPTSLAWTLRFFVQSHTSVMEALAEIASQPGALLSFEFDSFQQAFRLKYREPDRSATWTSGDPQFDESDIVGEVRELRYRLADIRNSGRVNYFDLDATADDDGGYPSESVSANDTASIDAYGLREFKISNAWNIDSAAEANSLASIAVSDMAQPPAHMSLPVMFRRFVEVNDFYRFDIPTRHFTTNKDMAVTTFTDTIGAEGMAVTTLQLRGQPMGNPIAWAGRMDPGEDRHRRNPLPAANVTLQRNVEGLDIKWDASVNPGRRDIDWWEVHVQSGTTSAFTPSSSTLKSVVRGSRATIQGLAPDTDHAVHVLPRDWARNSGVKSTVQTARPTFTALLMPSFRANRTTNQNLTGASTTKFQASNEQHDNNGDYDPTTNYRFTAPVDGIYHFFGRALIDFSKAAQWAQMSIETGGGATQPIEGPVVSNDGASAPANFADVFVSGTVELAANDTVECYFIHSDTCVVQDDNDCYWGGYLVTQTA